MLIKTTGFHVCCSLQSPRCPQGAQLVQGKAELTPRRAQTWSGPHIESLRGSVESLVGLSLTWPLLCSPHRREPEPKPWGSQEEEEAEEEPHHLQQQPAAGSGEGLREDALPRCLCAGGVGKKGQPQRGKSPGEQRFAWEKTIPSAMSPGGSRDCPLSCFILHMTTINRTDAWGVPAHTRSPLTAFSPMQVWFQNRRAKFRRNERAMLANRSASLLKSYSQEAAIEQPMAPRPTTLTPEYLSWTSTSPYR